MILGMSIPAFTTLHVIISLVGIGSGLVVLLGLLTGKGLPRWTALFLFTTILTSVTGFLFPIKQIGPPPFLVAQALTLGFFVLLGAIALKRFYPAATLRTAVLS
jgi:hypothetical protein